MLNNSVSMYGWCEDKIDWFSYVLPNKAGFSTLYYTKKITFSKDFNVDDICLATVCNEKKMQKKISDSHSNLKIDSHYFFAPQSNLTISEFENCEDNKFFISCFDDDIGFFGITDLSKSQLIDVIEWLQKRSEKNKSELLFYVFNMNDKISVDDSHIVFLKLT